MTTEQRQLLATLAVSFGLALGAILAAAMYAVFWSSAIHGGI